MLLNFWVIWSTSSHSGECKETHQQLLQAGCCRSHWEAFLRWESSHIWLHKCVLHITLHLKQESLKPSTNSILKARGTQSDELNKIKVQVHATRINTFWESWEAWAVLLGVPTLLRERGDFKFQTTCVWAYLAWVLEMLAKVNAHAAACQPQHLSIYVRSYSLPDLWIFQLPKSRYYLHLPNKLQYCSLCHRADSCLTTECNIFIKLPIKKRYSYEVSRFCFYVGKGRITKICIHIATVKGNHPFIFQTPAPHSVCIG